MNAKSIMIAAVACLASAIAVIVPAHAVIIGPSPTTTYAFDFFAGPGSYPNDNYLFLQVTVPGTSVSPGGTAVQSIFGSTSLPSLGIASSYVTGPAGFADDQLYAGPSGVYFNTLSFIVSTSVPTPPYAYPTYTPLGPYYIFTLSDPPATFPLLEIQPSTWAMLLLGFAAMGVMVWRRNARPAVTVG
jgi:hypothetical protein